MSEEIKITVVLATAGAKRNVKEFTGSLDDLEKKTKKSSDKASDSVKNLRSNVAKNLGKAGLAGIAVGASATVVMAYNRMMDKGAEFQQQQADLEAITGISGKALDGLGERALQLSVKYGESASNIIEANKLVASQLAEKIDFGTDEGIAQLQEVSEQAVILQKAAGVDLATSVKTLTTAINQFNLPASETNRLINSIAAGSKFGAAEVAEQAEAYKESGSVASAANVSFETLNASVQVLAANAIKGSQAGTQIRNVLLTMNNSAKLAEAGIEGVDLKSDGLAVSLAKLNPLLEDSAALEKLFGRESITAAQILIKNADSVATMTEKVTGSNTAMEQAEVQMNTYNGAQARLSAAIDAQLIPAFQESNGVMVKALNTMAEWVMNTGHAISVINDFFDAHSKLRGELELQEDALSRQVKAYKDLRQELAEAAESGKYNEEQQRELEQAYKNITESVREQASALYDETWALKQQKKAEEEAMESMAHTKYTRAEATKSIEELSLQIAYNERRLGTLKEELEAGSISWEDYIEQLRNANTEMAQITERPQVEILAPEFELPESDIMKDGIDLGAFALDSYTIYDAEAALASYTNRLTDYVQVSSLLGDHTNDINFALQETARMIEELVSNGYDEQDAKVQALVDSNKELQQAQQTQNAFFQAIADDQIKTLADIGNAIRQQVLNAIKARVAEAIADTIVQTLRSVPFPLNIALAAGAGATVSALFNQIPKFNSGVDNFEGGLAKVHKNEVITYLPKGSNVITNKNVEAMERMKSLPSGGASNPIIVQPSDNKELLAAIEAQTAKMETLERSIEFNISEFHRKYTQFKMKEDSLT